MQTFLSYNKNNKTHAQALRTNMTDVEQLLWSRIRKKQICNVQFYRQKSIGYYIVDFYAPSIKQVIEIDGGQHFKDEHMKRDIKRDKNLRDLGIKVLRFDNMQVLKEIDAVLDVIYRKTQNNLKSPRLNRLSPFETPPFEEKGVICHE